MKNNKIEIIGDKTDYIRARVLINGNEIHGVRGYRLAHYAGELPIRN